MGIVSCIPVSSDEGRTVRVLHINLVYLRCSGSSWDLVPGQYGKGLQEDFSLEDCWTLVTPVVEESHFELCLDAFRLYTTGKAFMKMCYCFLTRLLYVLALCYFAECTYHLYFNTIAKKYYFISYMLYYNILNILYIYIY